MAAVEEVLQAEALGVHRVALRIILVKELRQVRPAHNRERGEWVSGRTAAARAAAAGHARAAEDLRTYRLARCGRVLGKSSSSSLSHSKQV